MNRALLFTLLVLIAACGSEPADLETMNSHDPYAGSFLADASNTPDEPRAAATSRAGQRVVIVDQGLQMPSGAQVIPRDWTLAQDVALDAGTGQYARFRVDYRGPRGELIRSMGVVNYGEMFRAGFQQAWQEIARRGLQGEVDDFATGNPEPSAALMRTEGYQKTLQRISQQEIHLEALEVPIQGSRNGQPVQGVLYLTHLALPRFPGHGTVQASLLISPQRFFSETLQHHEQIASSFQPNPAHEQRVEQIRQVATQRQAAQHQQRMVTSQAQHQQRMASNQAQFNSHQQMMQNRYHAADRQHQQWMNDFRSSPSAYTGSSGYSGHDATIDGIYERSTFLDSYSGQQVQQDGNYDYWYTDGLGQYHGTNDPSFNPYSLGSNWQSTQPLKPDN